MRNRRRYSRRGISTVITTIMLLVAVSVIGAGLTSWSSLSFANQQQSIANQTDSRINLIKENFVIEDVWFYQNTTDMLNYANVTIRNTGDIAIRVTHVYINTTEAWDDSLVIPANSLSKISIQTSWEADKPQSFWITTARGSEVKQVWKS